MRVPADGSWNVFLKERKRQRPKASRKMNKDTAAVKMMAGSRCHHLVIWAGSGVRPDSLGAEANTGADHSDAEKTDDDGKEWG